MRNKIVNILVVILSACIFISFFVFSNGLNSLNKILQKSNINWLLLGAISMLLFWFLECYILHIITNTLYKEDKLFRKSVKYGMIGQFFSAVTPFQSGCQPAQLVLMTGDGIPAGTSGSILMIKFIIHQITLTIYSIIVIIARFSFFNAKISYLLYFCILGFVFNTFIIIMALLFSINRSLTDKILRVTLKILHKIRIVKDVESKYNKFETELQNFHDSAAIIAKHGRMCVISCLLTFLQWTAYYIIPYCIYRSFGFSSADVFTMISAQVFLLMLMSCIPLPGASGGAEGGFLMIFGLFFKSDAVMPALFIWRIITYYSCIAVGSIFTLFP